MLTIKYFLLGLLPLRQPVGFFLFLQVCLPGYCRCFICYNAKLRSIFISYVFFSWIVAMRAGCSLFFFRWRGFSWIMLLASCRIFHHKSSRFNMCLELAQISNAMVCSPASFIYFCIRYAQGGCSQIMRTIFDSRSCSLIIWSRQFVAIHLLGQVGCF